MNLSRRETLLGALATALMASGRAGAEPARVQLVGCIMGPGPWASVPSQGGRVGDLLVLHVVGPTHTPVGWTRLDDSTFWRVSDGSEHQVTHGGHWWQTILYHPLHH